MSLKKFNVAIVGATGEVGRQMREILEEREFPVKSLKLLASERSVGKSYEFRGEEIAVTALTEDSFDGVDIALFSAGGDVSKTFAPIAAKAGAVVIDNTSAWRMDPDVPLVVPEVNADAIADYPKKGIIANPNCSTIQMVVAAKPLHDRAKIKRIVVSTYQSVSGAGAKAIQEMVDQVQAIFAGEEVPMVKFPHPIAFNCLPQIDSFLDSGYTKEEQKMIDETKKIMDDPTIAVTATAVRVPVFYGHSESVNLEFERDLDPEEARRILDRAPGVKVYDDPSQKHYPLAIEAAGQDDVFVGRIRRDTTVPHGLNLWVVADNIRKGAATNAVQIAEILAEKYL